MSVIYKQGIGWSAVCPFFDSFAHIYNVDGGVEASADGRQLWLMPTPKDTDFIRYIDAASSPDFEVQAVGIGQVDAQDIAYVMRGPDWTMKRLGPVSGPYGVAIQWRDGEFKYYVKRSTEAYEVNGVRVPLPDRLRGEAYGFQFIRPDGTPVFWKDALAKYPGTDLQNWAETDGMLAGVLSGPEEVRAIVGGREFVAIPGPAHSIRIARNKDKFAIAAATRNGSAFLVVPPFPPSEVPVSVPDRSGEAAAFLSSRLVHVPGNEDATREKSFEAVNALCQEFRKTDTGWGTLFKSAGDRVRERAADVLLYRLNASEAQVVDVVGDAEGHDGPPRPGWSVKDIRRIDEWRPPYPVGGDDDDPGDTDPPAPPVDDEGLKLWMANIEQRVTALEAEVTKLKNARIELRLVL